MTAATSGPRPSADQGLLRAAFRELHGARLHGFALLATLGDRRLADALAGAALAEGARRAGELRHPDRAAAWLRARVAAGARRRHRGAAAPPDERRATLAQLGVEGPAFDALARLSLDERLALVGGWVEALDPRDLEGTLRFRPALVARMLARTRQHFLDAYVAAAPAVIPISLDPAADGPLARRIREIARRTLAPSGAVA